MSRMRLHALYGLPDPELDPASPPTPLLLEAARRYRRTTGGLDSAFFEAQSPKERLAFEEVAGTFEAAGPPGEDLSAPVTAALPLDPGRIERRLDARRALIGALQQAPDFPEVEEIGQLLDFVPGFPRLLDALCKGEITSEEAGLRLVPALRPIVALAHDRSKLRSSAVPLTTAKRRSGLNKTSAATRDAAPSH